MNGENIPDIGQQTFAKKVPSSGRQTFTDGHGLNESYKIPVPKIGATGKQNLSYMHPHGNPLQLEKPWQSVDKTLGEAGRHPSQLSNAKTVFPVSSGKVRGAPKPVQPLKEAKPPQPKIL
jgi:hypothetical protein